MKKILFILLIGFVTSLHAEPKKIFVWQDPNGVLVFSDTPKLNAEEIKLNTNPNIIKSVSAAIFDASNTEKNAKEEYKISIEQPKELGTVRDNTGSVYVSGKIEPVFERGLKVKLYLDGTLYGEAKNSSIYILRDVDRGEHRIYMELLDKSGKVIATSPTRTFYLHKNSIINPN
ncbi:DUF4124 domain-containing protein [Flocculibacter collagenilyticus]|uniref:DUF4124 domain-containing protein n=1 Tax=Flocculibacter collagenilyticus TaxID=2744479 RepID=UPI001F23D5D9|nr:DUF4124 domain-containing protein [Flocculibacter collagenilyticus]